MNPLNATTVKDNLTVPRHRHQEGCLGIHLTVFTFDLLDKEATSLVVDFDHAFAHLRYRQLYWTAAGSLDNRFQHLVGKRVERKRARRLVALRAADHRVERLQPSHAILLLVPGPSANEPDQCANLFLPLLVVRPQNRPSLTECMQQLRLLFFVVLTQLERSFSLLNCP